MPPRTFSHKPQPSTPSAAPRFAAPVPSFAPKRTPPPPPSAPAPRSGDRFELPPVWPQPRAQVPAPNRTGLPDRLKAGVESLSGLSLDDVRVRYNSSKPAQLNALAYAQGTVIHVAPGQEHLLPHESWHVVQQAQGRVKPTLHSKDGVAVNDDQGLEHEAETMGAKALASAARRDVAPEARELSMGRLAPAPSRGRMPPAQRQVRIDGGTKRVDEAKYLTGDGSATGSHTISELIADEVPRAFEDTEELEKYANGQLDYIGDVKTSSAGTFWYRLPKDKLTVLGEAHYDPGGNVENVIKGLHTSRFMYEPFNELAKVPALDIPFAGTQARLAQINASLGVSALVDREKYNPDLENIVIKALAAATFARNMFILKKPQEMKGADQEEWMGRASASEYSKGERTAFYLSIAIHLASDIAQHDFGAPNDSDSKFVQNGRELKRIYMKYQDVLDQFRQEKDASNFIGIYELTASKDFKNLNAILVFTLAFHAYATSYIEELGSQSGNANLAAQGLAFSKKKVAGVEDLNPVREEIMWEKVEHANTNGYLIAGMGEDHRINLQARFTEAKIANEEVKASLKRQKDEVAQQWAQ